MPIKELHFGFFGSFQCRLATDSDPPDVSPNVPAGVPDVAGRVNRPGKGWTFDFDEEAFDRVIRLSNPVNLRNGLVDPWRDTLSHGVRLDRGAGLVDVPGDPLTGLSVSLGQQVKFDASAGGGPGTEALVGFELGVGSLLKVTAPSPPRIRTTRGIPQSGVWWNEYKTVKKQRAEVIMHGMRRAVLLKLLTHYATVFGTYMGTVDGFVLNPPPLTASSGILKELAAQTGGGLAGPGRRDRWELHVDFYRFDADTLVGTVNGWVRAVF